MTDLLTFAKAWSPRAGPHTVLRHHGQDCNSREKTGAAEEELSVLWGLRPPVRSAAICCPLRYLYAKAPLSESVAARLGVRGSGLVAGYFSPSEPSDQNHSGVTPNTEDRLAVIPCVSSGGGGKLALCAQSSCTALCYVRRVQIPLARHVSLEASLFLLHPHVGVCSLSRW